MTEPVAYITLSGKLELVLSERGVEDYQPAYDGESACLDLYHAGGSDLVVSPGETVLIDTGVKIALPHYSVALILERGSITKTPLAVRAGVIDPGYTGPVFAAAINLGDQPWKIPHGEKLPFQLLAMSGVLGYKVINADHFNELTGRAIRRDGQIGSSD